MHVYDMNGLQHRPHHTYLLQVYFHSESGISKSIRLVFLTSGDRISRHFFHELRRSEHRFDSHSRTNTANKIGVERWSTTILSQMFMLNASRTITNNGAIMIKTTLEADLSNIYYLFFFFLESQPSAFQITLSPRKTRQLVLTGYWF